MGVTPGLSYLYEVKHNRLAGATTVALRGLSSVNQADRQAAPDFPKPKGGRK